MKTLIASFALMLGLQLTIRRYLYRAAYQLKEEKATFISFQIKQTIKHVVKPEYPLGVYDRLHP